MQERKKRTYERDGDDPSGLELLSPVLRQNDVAHLALPVEPHPSGPNLATEKLILEVDASLRRERVG